MLRRLLKRLFKGYQLMLLEPEGGKSVRHLHINLASLLGIILLLSMGPAALVWHYTPKQGEDLSARYYQLQQQNHDLRGQLATGEGELAVAREQIDGLKNELQASQQQNEELKQSKAIYESILQARKSTGVHILRAEARMEADDPTRGENKLDYTIVLVKGGNYPRSVSGSVLVVAFGGEGQKQTLQLGTNSAELPYKMDTHVFLEGSVIWKQDWQPVKLEITRMNSRGAERDQMQVDLDGTKSQ